MKQRKHTKQLSGAEEIPAARVQIGVCGQSSFFELEWRRTHGKKQ